MRKPNCGAFPRKIVSRLFRICVVCWFMQYDSPLLEWVLCHAPVHICISVHCLQLCANTIQSAWRKFRLILFYEGQYISWFFIMERFNCETNSYFPILRYTSWRLCSYIGMKRKCSTCLDCNYVLQHNLCVCETKFLEMLILKRCCKAYDHT